MGLRERQAEERREARHEYGMPVLCHPSKVEHFQNHMTEGKLVEPGKPVHIRKFPPYHAICEIVSMQMDLRSG